LSAAASGQSKYKQAAIAYAVYGVVYMIGAFLELNPQRMVTFWGFVPWWVFYAAGFAILFTFPIFIWRGLRWLTLTLVIFTSGKAFWLCLIQGRHYQAGEPISVYNLFFAAVAVVAAVMLFRAGIERVQEG
jgi:hypothetical protein